MERPGRSGAVRALDRSTKSPASRENSMVGVVTCSRAENQRRPNHPNSAPSETATYRGAEWARPSGERRTGPPPLENHVCRGIVAAPCLDPHATSPMSILLQSVSAGGTLQQKSPCGNVVASSKTHENTML